MSSSISYQFNPGDTVWLITTDNKVEQGKCLQSKIQIIPTDTSPGYESKISYIVLLTCNAGTYTVDDALAFPTMNDAITALETILTGPCPSPVVTPNYIGYYGMPENLDFWNYQTETPNI